MRTLQRGQVCIVEKGSVDAALKKGNILFIFLQADLKLSSEAAKAIEKTTQGEDGMLWAVTLRTLTTFLRRR